MYHQKLLNISHLYNYYRLIVMSQEYMEISKEDIENIQNAIKSGFSNYKFKDSDFSEDSFKNGDDIVLIQLVADNEYELPFQTKEEDGKYYISASFEIIKGDILNTIESGNVLESVSKYFWDVISDENKGFEDEYESLVGFLLLIDTYDEEQLREELNPSKIRTDYKNDHDRIYGDDSLNRVEKSLALKELVHMSVCQIVNDIDLFFTRPLNLTPEEESEKNRQEAKALENEMKMS